MSRITNGNRYAGRQRGSAMVVVMALLIALAAAGATALYLQLSDTRAAGYVKSSREALFCAEAGLAQARATIGGNVDEWNLALDADDTNDPAWYPITGDLDADNVDDYVVTIEDNNDDGKPGSPEADADLTVFVYSRCTKYPNTPRVVAELVTFEGGGHIYRNQSGQGSGNTGNAN